MTARGLLLCAIMLASVVAPAAADDKAHACIAHVAELRARAAALPEGDLSRRFAENDLDTALIEMAAGDVDECPALVERALRTISNRPYRLRPGETLDGYGPDTQG